MSLVSDVFGFSMLVCLFLSALGGRLIDNRRDYLKGSKDAQKRRKKSPKLVFKITREKITLAF